MSEKFLCPNCQIDLAVRTPVAGCCSQCGRDLSVKMSGRKIRHPGIAPPDGGLFEGEAERGPVQSKEVPGR